MEHPEIRRPLMNRMLAIVAGSLAFSACASGTSEEYSCTGDGRIRVEVVESGTWPKRTISSSIIDDVGGLCLDGVIDPNEKRSLA